MKGPRSDFFSRELIDRRDFRVIATRTSDGITTIAPILEKSVWVHFIRADGDSVDHLVLRSDAADSDAIIAETNRPELMVFDDERDGFFAVAGNAPGTFVLHDK